MAKPRTPNQKNQYKELNGRLNKYVALVEQIYETLNGEAAKAVTHTDYSADTGKPFKWADYPQTKKSINDLQDRFVEELHAVIYRGTSEEWKNSNEVQDLLANRVLKAYDAEIDGKKRKVLYQTNSDALKAFQERKEKGMNLSAKLWNQSVDYKNELEAAISCAIQKGTSAITLSKQVSKYLQDFPSLQKDYTERYGKASRVQDCEYRSIRLARSEINMAYRKAENERWKQMDFVVGYEIKPSTSHDARMPDGDVCDTLAGKYPKDFEWTGWHPNCYSDDSMVLTNNGWKLFKDVCNDDLILSLNPETRSVEWTEIVATQCYSYKGVMEHFFNKHTDCLVTPDHRMIYLNKSNGRIKECSAKEYRKGKGALYRGCEYEGSELSTFSVDNLEIPFDLFCEFMGYWLSDGNTQGSAGIVISQQKGELTYARIIDCIREIGFEPTCYKSYIVFYCTPFCSYLKIFGRCNRKFIPPAIKNASKRQIQLFLDAFVQCDGYVRPFRTFTGNHGKGFTSEKQERLYFTTSPRMAGDISELLLKVGHRPSLKLSQAKQSHKVDGSVINANYDCYIIRECYSATTTVFEKQEIPYDGYVYDLTLAKNHIMYVCRNGRCFWGSNCMCYKISILKTEEEFWDDTDKESVNQVNGVPKEFEQWVRANKDRIEAAKARGTQPYFIRDNEKVVEEILKKSSEPATLQHLEDVISNYQFTDPKLKERETEINAMMKELFDNSDFGMHISSKHLESVFEKGFLNTFQTGTSGGYEGSTKTTGAIEETHQRLVSSHRMFSKTDDSTLIFTRMHDPRYTGKQLDRSEYEKFGLLLDKDRYNAYFRSRALSYGDAQIRFKKDRVKCTWTFGNSLVASEGKDVQYLQPSLVTDPRVESFNKKLDYSSVDDFIKNSNRKSELEFREKNECPYIELQYHGQLTIDDVESITWGFIPPDECISKELIKKLEEKGIELWYNSGPRQMSQYKLPKD